jgi:hypothetical protein
MTFPLYTVENLNNILKNKIIGKIIIVYGNYDDVLKKVNDICIKENVKILDTNNYKDNLVYSYNYYCKESEENYDFLISKWDVKHIHSTGKLKSIVENDIIFYRRIHERLRLVCFKRSLIICLPPLDDYLKNFDNFINIQSFVGDQRIHNKEIDDDVSIESINDILHNYTNLPINCLDKIVNTLKIEEICMAIMPYTIDKKRIKKSFRFNKDFNYGFHRRIIICDL